MGGTHLEKGPVEPVAYPRVVVQPEGLQAGEGQQGRTGRGGGGVSTLWVALTWKRGLLKQSHIQGLGCSLRVCRLDRGSMDRLDRKRGGSQHPVGGTHLEKGPVEAVAYPGVVVQSEGLQAGEGEQGQAGQEGGGDSAPCG